MKKALQLDHNHIWAHVYLSDYYLIVRKYEEGFKSLTKAVNLASRDELKNVLGSLRRFYAMIGTEEKAEQITNRIDDLYPDESSNWYLRISL